MAGGKCEAGFAFLILTELFQKVATTTTEVQMSALQLWSNAYITVQPFVFTTAPCLISWSRVRCKECPAGNDCVGNLYWMEPQDPYLLLLHTVFYKVLRNKRASSFNNRENRHSYSEMAFSDNIYIYIYILINSEFHLYDYGEFFWRTHTHISI